MSLNKRVTTKRTSQRTPSKLKTTVTQENITNLIRNNPKLRTKLEAQNYLNKLQKKYLLDSMHVTKEGKIYGISKNGTITHIGKDEKTSPSTISLKHTTKTTVSQTTRKPEQKMKILKIIQGEGGTTTPTPRQYQKPTNSVLKVTAIPHSGSVFSHWETPGNKRYKKNPLLFTIKTNSWIKAVFKKRENV